ncbi:putative defense protein 3 isoform X2 [Uloborus diversus]|uniref:putative defense protein 3 isoform X1 n=1 Tax=Uloborus diversus TaxID=327109 RepID=UPI002409978D|nr:putative defense protein 3 isoform X1 [Uloborus diversus]XP_054708771.1 putative defense protein 3 isoform X2 [Uloborus diversus]
MASRYLLIISVASVILAVTKSYPSGAPEDTCKTFNANHTGVSAQNSQPKYDLTVSPSSVAPGGIVKVTLQGTGGETFRGFFIQGFDASNKAVGKFRKQADAQTRDCSGPGSATAATHVNNNDKTKVVLTWQAPASFSGKVNYRAVVVKTYEYYWNNIKSNQLTVA